MAGAVGRDVAEQMGDDALGQVIGFNLVGDGKPLQLRHQTPVAADDALDEALMGEVVETTIFAIALAGGIDESEVFRFPGRLGGLFFVGEIKFFECKRYLLGEADADEPPVATVSPSRMSRTASAALTTFPFSAERR